MRRTLVVGGANGIGLGNASFMSSPFFSIYAATKAALRV